MGDYIRGKKAYTKWDADSENIDIEYRPDGQKSPAQEGWLSGTKGIVIKVLLLLLLFCSGIIIGYLLRRGVHENVHTAVAPSSFLVSAYTYTKENRDRLQNEIKAENIESFLKNYTLEPHIAGKPSSQKYAEYIRDEWISWGLDDVNIEKFKVLLSYPSSVEPNRVQIVKETDGSVRDAASESGDDELHPDLRPYLAYSPNLTAKGKLVYANYGRKEDFDYLRSQNVSVNGSVVIMRLGKIHMSNKIESAEFLNATGALLYPDPADYVNQMPIYPKGLGLPADAVIRGSLNLDPGDPQTPTLPATEQAYHNQGWKLNLPRIPVQPISYNNALKFMSEMDGPDAPSDWQGGLNMTYRLGPGYKGNGDEVRLEIHNELKEEDIFNVIGTIRGKYEPDRYVIVGNHHDSWTNGTGDPGTGLASFMEVVRAFSELKKEGWQPGRTLIFTCWDAEEFGMIGSTEWLQLHAKELASRAVAYINTDAGVRGNDTIEAFGSPLLQSALHAAAREVPFPIQRIPHFTDSVYTQWKALSTEDLESLEVGPILGILGSGSDYAAFMSTYGISSIHLQFVSKDKNFTYPLYHSAYDNFEAVANFVDPGFQVSQTLARLVATLALQLTDSLKLPMTPEDYGRAVQAAFKQFNQTYGSQLKDMNVPIDNIEKAVETFAATTISAHNDYTLVTMKDELLSYHEYNDRLLELERAFTIPHWEMPQLFYRHAIFGPHPYDIGQGIAFPLLVESILNAQDTNATHDTESIQMEVAQVVQALQAATGVLKSCLFAETADGCLHKNWNN